MTAEAAVNAVAEDIEAGEVDTVEAEKGNEKVVDKKESKTELKVVEKEKVDTNDAAKNDDWRSDLPDDLKKSQNASPPKRMLFAPLRTSAKGNRKFVFPVKTLPMKKKPLTVKPLVFQKKPSFTNSRNSPRG